MPTINAIDVNQFWQNGAALMPNVLPESTIRTLRNDIEMNLPRWQSEGLIIKHTTGGRLKTDMLANPLLRQVLFDTRIVTLARDLLGTDPIYFGDSTFAYGTTSRAWHRDNRTSDRINFKTPDWEDRYPLIRIGLYLQDHSCHSGGLGVRLGSHLPSPRYGFLNSSYIPKRLQSYLANHTGKPIHMNTKLGDLAVWTLRTLHSADGIRLKWMPHLRLAPLIENKLPSWTQLPSDGLRMACFMTFAAPSAHLDRYVCYLAERDYMREMWTHSVWDKTVLEQASLAGIKVIAKEINTLMTTAQPLC